MTSVRHHLSSTLPATSARPSRGGGKAASAIAALLALGTLAGQAPAAGSAALVEPLQVVYDTWTGALMRGPLGIVMDARRREVLLANTSGSRVEIYDFEGFPIGTFVHRVEQSGVMVDGFPKWLAVDSTGQILVSDQLAAYVDVVDYAGTSVRRLTLPEPDHSLEEGGGPGAITVTRDGRILVAGRGNAGRVYEFGADYALVRAWGDSGSAPGRLSRITGIAQAPNGEIFVACVGTELAVQAFDAKGRFLRGHGRHEIGSGNFSYPSGITVTADGRVWVSDEIRQMVQVFDAAGAYLGVVGGPGLGRGEFLYPSAVATDGQEYLAVSERGGNRFQILKLR